MSEQWAIAVVSALFGIVGTYIAKDRNRKVLGWRVVSTDRLVTADASVSDKLKILYDGREVTDPHFVTVILGNVGNQPVMTEDFNSPLFLKFGEASLLSCGVTRHTTGLEAKLTVHEDSGTAELAPMLLNPREYLLFQAITSRMPEVNCYARIIGGSTIKRPDPNVGPPYAKYVSVLLFALVCALTWIIGRALWTTFPHLAWGWKAFVTIIVFFVQLMGFVYITSTRPFWQVRFLE